MIKLPRRHQHAVSCKATLATFTGVPWTFSSGLLHVTGTVLPLGVMLPPEE